MVSIPSDFKTTTHQPCHEMESVVVWMKDDIVFSFFKPGVVHDLSQAKILVALLSDICKETKKPLLMDFRMAEAMNLETRMFYSGFSATKNVSCICIITDSLFSRTLANFYYRIKRPMVPLMIFNSVEKAKRWCRIFNVEL